MLENYLVSKNYSLKVKITVKTIVSLIIIVLALVLPQITHAFLEVEVEFYYFQCIYQ